MLGKKIVKAEAAAIKLHAEKEKSKEDEVVVHGQKSKVTTVALSPSYLSNDKLQLQAKIEALLANSNDPDHEELRMKIELLKGRYQHAVKTELINFCYASTHASGDDGLLSPEAGNNRSPEFIKTLMNIVENDKQIAEIAVNVVEEIDLMETAKLQYVGKRYQEKNDEAALKQIWESHKKSRKEIAKLLDEEQSELYPDKVYNFPPPDLFDEMENEKYNENDGVVEQVILEKGDNQDENDGLELSLLDEFIDDKVRIEEDDMNDSLLPLETTLTLSPPANEEEEEDEDEIIKRGIQRIMCSLGCDVGSVSGDITSNLNLIREKMLAVKKDIQTLKS